jgi:peptidoglycan/LPS O-acetylase OafA/YrhL
MISYSFYIWHKEIQNPAAHLVRSLPVLQQQVALGLIMLVGTTLVGTTLVAYVSFQLVERPFFNARKRTQLAG